MLVSSRKGTSDGNPALFIDSTVPADIDKTQILLAPATTPVHIGDTVTAREPWRQYRTSGMKSIYTDGWTEAVAVLTDTSNKVTLIGYFIVPDATRSGDEPDTGNESDTENEEE